MTFKLNLLALLTATTAYPSLSCAETLEFSRSTYKEAKAAESFLRFDMASTKFGFITTSFTGFAKKFKIHGDIKNEELQSGAVLEFGVKELDTDVDGRNEKMWHQCLDEKNHPIIRMTINQAVPLTGQAIEAPATITVRGIEKPLSLKVKAFRADGKITLDISGSVTIKELELPDPSITIASVRDRIDLTSHLVIAK